ncbi:MAG: VOC family protein [Rhizobiaceae bacterium]|nr:VOC family protein [Rhizobiaceae bacterium]MCV0409020.1 VOC family protein [Rhizobiaceae bacterium]
MTRRKDVHRFFHINVNCTDFDRSLAFYQALGFEVVNPLTDDDGGRRTFSQIGFNHIFRMEGELDARGCLLALDPDDRGAMRLDLLEWTSPAGLPAPERSLAHPGMARLCLKASDADAVHDRLKALGHVIYSPPKEIEMGGSRFKVFCCEDPDGVVIELMEFVD